VAAFKAKAEAELDRIHGFHDDKEHEHNEEEKPRHEKKKERAEKV
jgi:hypothetical protein